jgi:hypothetical protein
MGMSGYSTTVLVRTGTLASQAHGITLPLLRRQNPFNNKAHLPAVTKVVLVPKHGTLVRHDVPDPCDSSVSDFDTNFDIPLRIGYAIMYPADIETIQVIVPPSHYNLEQPMQPMQRGIIGIRSRHQIGGRTPMSVALI